MGDNFLLQLTKGGSVSMKRGVVSFAFGIASVRLETFMGNR